MSALRVIKLGGSLLDRRDLPARIELWLAAQSAAKNVFVVGGGRIVEALRDIDRTHALDPVCVHWLALDAMSITDQVVSILLEQPVVHSLEEVRRAPAGSTLILDVASTLRTYEPQAPGVRLEAGWHVTSDSIAARIALMVDADELVLLKSAPPPSTDLGELAARGYVDAFFPCIARELSSVRFVEL